MKFIDLRSDTVTQPTQNMRQAMFTAEVGDDVYGDDLTVIALEEYAAKLVGKEAALFVPSGTFGNQLALFTHCTRGNEVILGDDCHIVVHEVAGSSIIAGVQLRTLISNKGELDPKQIQARIRKEDEDIHYPSTGLICIENAHSCGRVIPLSTMEKIYTLANQQEVPVHLDGARLFNAAAYLDVDAKEITKYCDTVMFCLSKALCAPIGSILAGDKKFIAKARKKRKVLGGGLRQVGILAAAGLIALQEMIPQLKIDHENAILLGEELSKIPGIVVNKEDTHINMVYFDMSGTGLSSDKLVEEFFNIGIKINGVEDGLMRFVTHNWVSEKDIKFVITALKEILKVN